jgi:hypothetical protein
MTPSSSMSLLPLLPLLLSLLSLLPVLPALPVLPVLLLEVQARGEAAGRMNASEEGAVPQLLSTSSSTHWILGSDLPYLETSLAAHAKLPVLGFHGIANSLSGF